MSERGADKPLVSCMRSALLTRIGMTGYVASGGQVKLEFDRWGQAPVRTRPKPVGTLNALLSFTVRYIALTQADPRRRMSLHGSTFPT
jgi:hypothetical protein